MTHLSESDLKFIRAANRARQCPCSWWLSAAVPVGLFALISLSLAYILSWHFSRRGLEFVICMFYQGKYEPTNVQLGNIFAFFFCVYGVLSTFIFFYAYLAWKTQSRASKIIEKIVGDEGPNPQGGANGRQPLSSETSRTSAAAASRRSP